MEALSITLYLIVNPLTDCYDACQLTGVLIVVIDFDSLGSCN